MKVRRYYDIECEVCGRFVSTDFSKGFADSRNCIIKWAREAGFKTVKGKFICPECVRR